MIYPRYETMNRIEWLKCMAHDHDNPSRAMALAKTRLFLNGEDRFDLSELGFCSGWDFRCAFKGWHDDGLIWYRGYDTCEQFVMYARQEWPYYDWHLGSSEDMYECDVSYVRHVAMTMAPGLWLAALASLLRMSRLACIVTYRMAPAYNDHYCLEHTEGDRHIWTNRYDRGELEEIYGAEGFAMEIIPVQSDAPEAVWVARRK